MIPPSVSSKLRRILADAGCGTIEAAANYPVLFWFGRHSYGRKTHMELTSLLIARGLRFTSGPIPTIVPIPIPDEPPRPPRTRKYHREGTVYFIQPENGNRVKIGFCSGDVQKRIIGLQTGSSEPLKVIGLIPNGGRKLERALHERFKAHRVHLEWFALAPDIIDFIKAEAAI